MGSKRTKSIFLGDYECRVMVRDSKYYDMGDGSCEASYHYEYKFVEMDSRDLAIFLGLNIAKANEIIELFGLDAIKEGLCDNDEWLNFCSEKYEREH